MKTLLLFLLMTGTAWGVDVTNLAYDGGGDCYETLCHICEKPLAEYRDGIDWAVTSGSGVLCLGGEDIYNFHLKGHSVCRECRDRYQPEIDEFYDKLLERAKAENTSNIENNRVNERRKRLDSLKMQLDQLKTELESLEQDN